MTESDIITTEATLSETVALQGPITISRKILLVLPWVAMALMSVLMYENMGLASLLIALLGFVISFFGKKSKGISRTPEVILLLLTTMAATIEVMNPLWVKNISLPLGVLGIVLFLVIGNINWEN